ncbi:MAG: DUF1634 domain-containing protein [Ktedonobacterales bacterium]
MSSLHQQPAEQRSDPLPTPPNTPTSPGGGLPPEREALVRQAELAISYVLRGGVLLSALIILIGVVAFYRDYFATSASTHAINITVFPHTLGSVGAGVAHGDPLAIIVLGLLVLLATPFARVAVSIFAFALERDWRYVAITTLVLLILIVSFVLGKGGA